MSKADQSPTTPESSSSIEELTQERQELIDQLQRLQAEFDNYRKRIQKEQEEGKAAASEKLLRDFLPITDSLQLALHHAKDEHGKIKAEDLLAGLIMINEQMGQLLEHQGLDVIKTDGRFDPRLHEAITSMEQHGAEKGAILQTYQRGYLLGTKVLRPAKVSVAR